MNLRKWLCTACLSIVVSMAGSMSWTALKAQDGKRTDTVAESGQRRLVYVRHLEPPRVYPPLGRQARLQGTVMVKLTIAAGGIVLAANASSDDSVLKKVPLLQTVTAELVKKWTFGCFDCAVGENYEHTIRFVYKLEGNPKEYDDTRVVFDLPTDVTITAAPPVCDHCPPPAKSNDKAPAKPNGKIYSIP